MRISTASVTERAVVARFVPWLCAVLLVGASSPAHAALITVDPGGTVIDFSQFTTETTTAGPVQVGGLVSEDVIFTGHEFAFLGQGDAYLTPVGRSWTDQSYAGVNDPRASITFAFGAAPVMGVGGFMNYATPTIFITPVTLQVLGADLNTILESYVLNTDAPISAEGGPRPGAFRGISRNGPDIHGFRIIGGYGVIDDLTFWRDTGEPDPTVPEPATGLLLLLGVGAAMARRSRRVRRMRSRGPEDSTV